MKIFRNTFYLAFIAVFAVQCTFIDEENLVDPLALPPSAVDPDFLLNNIQLEAQNVYEDARNDGGEFTRMTYMFGSTYENAFSPNSFDDTYGDAYADLFKDYDNLIPIAREAGLYFHIGMAQALKANAMITLVDMFGDVPYSEALDETNLNPALDSGESVYTTAIALLDSAVANFANENRRAMPDIDFYYDGSTADLVENWTRFANTVKLKAYLNTGNAAAFNALVATADDDLIVDDSQDFTFGYSTVDTNPDSRHPLYAGNYVDDAGAGAYMSVSYMNMLLTDKDFVDPRMYYYFYRQTTTDPTDINENTCLAAPAPSHFDADDPWCLLGDGWWGRDHLIDDGIPPDGNLRTTYGVYPVGGSFDRGAGGTADRGDGEGGAGFDAILMSSFTHFMIAEGHLTFNSDAASARTSLETAIEISLETVEDFGADESDGSGFAMVDTVVAGYNAVALGRYDAAANDTERLRQVIKEYYFAAWPNGYEAWNAMRRTGFPDRDDNLQPARSSSPGTWYRSALYPSTMVERNINIDQKTDVSVGPFWDPNSGSTKFDF